MRKIVNIIGGGLAGCECAYQLSKRGIEVNLYDMKPKFTPAHKSPNLGELVCSNSLKSDDILTAGGLLKEELRLLDSLLIKIADKCRVPAGNSLSVDREKFSSTITQYLSSLDNVHIIREEVTTIDTNIPTVIASGPLTSEPLSEEICKLVGQEKLYFFDAIAPIIDFNSIDMNIAYFAYTEVAAAKDASGAVQVDASAAANVQYTEVYEVVTPSSENLNLRTVPSTASNDTIVVTIHSGDMIFRTGVGNNGWSKVLLNGVELYASSSYLKKVM